MCSGMVCKPCVQLSQGSALCGDCDDEPVFIEPNIKKKQRSDAEDAYKLKCVICTDKERGAAFIPCGHVVCCTKCSLLAVGGPCPICRCDVVASMRVFV
jgi:hypothetical protein